MKRYKEIRSNFLLTVALTPQEYQIHQNDMVEYRNLIFYLCRLGYAEFPPQIYQQKEFNILHLPSLEGVPLNAAFLLECVPACCFLLINNHMEYLRVWLHLTNHSRN